MSWRSRLGLVEPDDKKEDPVNDPRDAVTEETGRHFDTEQDTGRPLPELDEEQTRDDLSPIRAAADANLEDTEDEGDPCPTCGVALPPARWFLADTVNKVATRAHELLAQFYGNLLGERPDLARMFPADLIDAMTQEGEGFEQREKLLNAVVAVATHFNPRNKKSMAALDAALEQMGSTHGESRFWIEDPAWPGGRRPLLAREYDAVNFHVITTLKSFYGDGWTPQHHAAWWTAMTYVADKMGAAQILNAPRHAA